MVMILVVVAIKRMVITEVTTLRVTIVMITLYLMRLEG